MVQVKESDNGHIIAKKILWAPHTADDSYICLMAHIGEDMTYDAFTHIVNYPGEYDIQGIQCKVWASKDGELNYAIMTKSATIVLCQTKKYLQTDDIPDSVDSRIFTTEKLRESREKMEFEDAEVIVLETLGQEKEAKEEKQA
jgi:hypothetical protein